MCLQLQRTTSMLCTQKFIDKFSIEHVQCRAETRAKQAIKKRTREGTGKRFAGLTPRNRRRVATEDLEDGPVQEKHRQLLKKGRELLQRN